MMHIAGKTYHNENSQRRYSRFAAIVALLGVAHGGFAQSTLSGAISFEAASVRPAKTPMPDAQGRMVFARPTGGPGTNDPGRIVRPNMSLIQLLMAAYNLKRYQVAGPAWIESERYDVTATMPPDTTMERYRLMLQNLLVSRFKMTVHRENRELAVYYLTVAKSGPKLPEKVSMPSGVPADKIPAETIMMTGRGQILARQQTMQQFAEYLGIQIGAPCVDRTNISGKHDLALHYSPEGLNGPSGQSTDATSEPDLFAAVQTQLGLKLERGKGPVEVLVIDKADRNPISN